MARFFILASVCLLTVGICHGQKSKEEKDKSVGSKEAKDKTKSKSPYAEYIKQLEESREKIENRLDTQCTNCENEARRKILRSSRCEAVLCDYESTNLCKWKTQGSPGAPVPILEEFFEENPEFAQWYAQEKLKSDANRRLRHLYYAARRFQARHRSKRQSIADTLAGLQSQIGGGEENPLSPAAQAIKDRVGPSFGEPALEAAAKAAADLQGENRIPTDFASLLSKIEADKTWGVYGGEFARHVTGLSQASQGEKYATSYLYPGEWAVMSTVVDLSDGDYIIRFDGFEHNEDVRLYLACDTPDRVALSTPIPGTFDKRRQWETFAGKCPQGTKRILFVCENVSQTKEGACAIDDVQMFTSFGVDYCAGVDPISEGGDVKLSAPAATEPPNFIYTPGPYPATPAPPGAPAKEGLAKVEEIVAKAKEAANPLNALTGGGNPLGGLGGLGRRR